MAKRKKTDEAMSNDAVQSFIDEQIMGQKKVGMDPLEAAASDVGLRLPHLCLRYLVQRTTLPFERSLIIFGPPGSNKSSFLCWLYGFVYAAGGRYLHLEVEDKDIPELRLSLTGYKANAGRVVPCESMDHFQRQVKEKTDYFKAVCGRAGGPGRRVPFIVGIDSLVAKMTEEAYGVVDKDDGATGRRFADEARSLSDWFKVVPKYITGWPIYLAAVNHDKPVKGERFGQTEHKSPGGHAPNFYSTYRILLNRVRKFAPNRDGWQGNRIAFCTEKNSLGADKLRIEAEIAWRPTVRPNVNGDLVPAQDTVWNWHKATTEMLERIQAGKGPAGRVVEEYVGLSKDNGRYRSATLGVRGDQAMSASEFGRYIESLPDLLAELEPRLGIRTGRPFDPGVDLLDQIAAARRDAAVTLPAPYLVQEAEAPAESVDEAPDDAEDEADDAA